MASSNNQNPFAQFEDFFKAFKTPTTNVVDFKKASEIQQKTADSFAQAGKTFFDAAQKLAKSQTEFWQEQAQIAANIASKSLSAKSPEENIDTHTRYAQAYFDTNLQNLQSVAKSASDTSVKVFDIINKQAVENLSEISKVATKKAS